MTCDDVRVALAAGLDGEDPQVPLRALGRVSGGTERRLPTALAPGRG
ncbi:hypothetical protein [Micromonospora sp. NPDC005299]